MSEKITKLIEEVKELTVLELADLVSALEEEFGVSAAAGAVVVAAGAAAGGHHPAGQLPSDVRRPPWRGLHPGDPAAHEGRKALRFHRQHQSEKAGKAQHQPGHFL